MDGFELRGAETSRAQLLRTKATGLEVLRGGACHLELLGSIAGLTQVGVGEAARAQLIHREVSLFEFAGSEARSAIDTGMKRVASADGGEQTGRASSP